jgi:hypothetical protein
VVVPKRVELHVAYHHGRQRPLGNAARFAASQDIVPESPLCGELSSARLISESGG